MKVQIEKDLEWHKDRQKFIGGSDVGAVLGVNPYLSALELYNQKVAEIPVIEEDNDATLWGKLLEPAIISGFEIKEGKRVYRRKKSYQHKEYPFMSSQIDAVCYETGEIVEAKSVSGWVKKNWQDEIPLSYYCQLQYQFLCSGKEKGFIALLVDGRQFDAITFYRDDEFIEGLEEKVKEFWYENVQKRVPPPPMSESDLKLLFPNHDPGKVHYAGMEEFYNYNTLLNIKNEIKIFKEQESDLKLKIQKAMKDAEKIVMGDEVLATWKHQTQNRFDQKAFKKDHPELFKKYTKQTEIRKFLPKEIAQ